MSGFRESPQQSLADLDFAADAVRGLATVLRDGFGFSVDLRVEPGLTTARLGRLVRKTLKKAGPDTVLLVHLLTHGEVRDDSLYALGADALLDESTDIGGWLTGLQHVEGRPLVLFTLDLCNSGTVTQIPWQAQYDRTGRRGWVVAACEPERDAFNGHFTLALTEVLGDMAVRTDLSPLMPYIPLGTLVGAVRRATVRLADTSRTYRQYVTASRVEVGDEQVVLPLFPNPAHLGADARALVGSQRMPGTDRSLDALLDRAENGADLRHFVDSVTGLNGFHDSRQGFGAAFTGRAHALHLLSRWLGGEDTAPLAVVTGSPGAGKSALLGLVVCAAHPKLRASTRAAWTSVATAPPQLDRLVVAHARGCGIEALAGKVARQLGLETDTPEQLLAALGTQDLPPTLVVDALDEADDAAAVCHWLARAAALTRTDGSAAIRVLVATRTSEESAELRGAAEASDHCVDLDRVAPSELDTDLHAYVSKLLRGTPEYHDLHQAVGAFAGALAGALVAHRGSGWGEFLVAGLYTRHFLTTFDPEAGSDRAQQLGAEVPSSLPEVLDLDLAHRSDDPWLRPVLTVLAHARGEGMPVSVVQRAVARLYPGGPAPSLTDIQDALTAGHTYLRRSFGGDAVVVHRLFHSELAQHLRRDQAAEPVFHSLLDGLGPAERRQWSAAEPYVLRHAISHAAHGASPKEKVEEIVGDPGYLLRADPELYLPALPDAVRRVVSRWLGAARGADRRTALALAAVEEGQPGLARRIADEPGEPPLLWLPLWAAGRDGGESGSAEPDVAVLTSRGTLRFWHWQQPGSAAEDPGSGAPRALAFGRVEGQTVLVVGTSQGKLLVTTREGGTTSWPRHNVAVTALAVADRAGTAVVVSGSSDGEVAVHALADGGQVGPTVRVPGGAVPGAIAAVGHGSSVVVACVTGSGLIHSWFCDETETPVPHTWSTAAPVCSAAVGSVGERLVLVTGCVDGAIEVWDMQTHARERRIPGQHGPAHAVAVGLLDTRWVAVVGSGGGCLTMWDLATFQQVGVPIPVDREPIRSLTLTQGPDGELCCLISGDGSTALWSLDRRAPLRNFGQNGVAHADLAAPRSARAPRPSSATAPVTAVGSIAAPAGATGTTVVAVYGDEDGTCHAVDATTGLPAGEPLAGDGHAVDGVEEIMLGGTAAVLVRSARTRRVWDIGSGAHSERLPWQEGDRPPTDPCASTAFVGGDLVTVSVEPDGEVRAGTQVMGRHEGGVTALRAARLGGRPVAVSGGADGTVRIWGLEECRPLDLIDFGRPVLSLATAADGLLLVVAGGHVYALEHLSRRGPC
ncbi:hypothetical protein ACEZDB_14305 [Streptacidiphilus sp. N1-3]|uniref:WD40 repeat protein n=1 Tax=Streptacidiphilus alkalitolerans TaxID=3342712 RepID=A0ABV6X1U1_9ACTN